MALSASTVIEVRSTGTTTGGGGFVTGSGGTDYSQQDSPQLTVTDGACTGNTTLTSATGGFTAQMVGNILYLSSGPGWYQITAHTDTNTVTIDRNGPNATGMTVNVGGALSTIALGMALLTVTGMQMYIKATATYVIGTGLSTPAGILVEDGIIRVIGYTTTRGDLGRPVIQTSAAITAITDSRGGFRFENLDLDGNSTGSTGFTLSGVANAAFNCIVRNFTGTGINMTGGGSCAIQCEVTGCDTLGINMSSVGGHVHQCYVHDNSCPGIQLLNVGGSIIGNIVDTNTGASSDGIFVNTAYGNNQCTILQNTIYNNGRDGIKVDGNYRLGEIANNIMVSNGRYGLNTSAFTPVRDEVLINHNAYYNNATANRNSNNAGTGDVTLTGDPFTDAAGGDFSLNNTAGAGADLRAAGYPGVMIGGGTGYRDIGALQHQETASVGGGSFTFAG